MAKQVVHIDLISDSDEILLPSGGELDVIELLVKFFTGQVGMPKDYIIDGRADI